MKVTLLYLEGCPNWQQTEALVREALGRVGVPPSSLSLSIVASPEEADRLAFHGSPTVLVDGEDPFAEPGQQVGLTCRLYRTPAGPAGSPTLEQLVAAFSRP